jgi:septal ring factor EnvC (AmiA/AmiB activator)
MRRYILCIFFIFLCSSIIFGQSRAELEARKKATLDEIDFVDNLLKVTSKEKNESLNDIKIIGNKVDLRESVIRDLQDEISMVNERIELNNIAIGLMKADVESMKKDYCMAAINSYKLKKSYPEIIYIISAKDFNQGYKRMKYFQQAAEFRRNEAETILELKLEIEDTKKRLEDDLQKISELKGKEEVQKSLLLSEQNSKQKMVKTLSGKEKQLKRELEEKKRVAEKIESEITRLIEEERRKASKSEVTSAEKLMGDSFGENKGKLPWPVEKGIITSHFGVQQHPVLKYLTEENIGIEITGTGKMSVHSVFKGEVMKVFAISGVNMTVIIRHGKYLTVYSNLVNLKVKKGDKVGAYQELGEVYSDPGNNSSVLKFMIFETKYQDPELWIKKNRVG